MRLQRYAGNPVLQPNPAHPWEALNVFNAAVVPHNGLFHMLYRAQGGDYVSHIGYAASPDGLTWWRMDRPVLSPASSEEARGVEDPRVSRLGDSWYMVYTAYSSQGIRVALAATENFLTWQRMGIILPGEDNKDAGLFPEKVGGRYCLLHRRPPAIWLAYSDDLLHWENHRVVMHPLPGTWESARIGIAGPPIRTPQGWLLVYHGVDTANVYRLGVALLDLDDPTVVRCRQAEPILEPQEAWELKGDVPNVVFSDAALLREDGALWIYYGGADRCMGLAIASPEQVRSFLEGGGSEE